MILGAALSFVGGAIIEFTLIRPAGKKSPLAVVVVAIGLFQALNSLSGLLFEGAGDAIAFPSLFPSKPTDYWRISDTVIWRYKDMMTLGLVLVVTAALFLLFQKTKVGLAMRMVANNTDSAKLVGVNTNRILMLSWGISAAIGAIGGALVASINTNVNLATMFEIFLLASAAATLGGLDSPIGAVIGGLSLGIVQSLVSNYPSDWWGSSYIGAPTAIAVAFVIILAVLVVRPSGLFGTSRVERV
jgi:branched-chain amino acid transport system permease protein